MIFNLSKSNLRPWKMNDIDSLVKNANNPHIAQFMRDVFPNPYTENDASNFIQNIASSTNNLIMAIEVKEKAVGSIGLAYQTDVYRHNAELGYWIGEKHQGQGITTEAVNAIVNYCLSSLDIHRVYASIFENNIASKKVLIKCGFILEAIHRKAVFKNNYFVDEHVYVKIK